MFIDKNVIPHLMRNPVPYFLDSPVKPENDEYRCFSIRYLTACCGVVHYKRIKCYYIVIASDQRERGNLILETGDCGACSKPLLRLLRSMRPRNDKRGISLLAMTL